MVVRRLLCGCENWTSLTERERRTETAEMKCVRSVAGCTLCTYKTRAMKDELIIYILKNCCALLCSVRGHSIYED